MEQTRNQVGKLLWFVSTNWLRGQFKLSSSSSGIRLIILMANNHKENWLKRNLNFTFPQYYKTIHSVRFIAWSHWVCYYVIRQASLYFIRNNSSGEIRNCYSVQLWSPCKWWRLVKERRNTTKAKLEGKYTVSFTFGEVAATTLFKFLPRNNQRSASKSH